MEFQPTTNGQTTNTAPINSASFPAMTRAERQNKRAETKLLLKQNREAFDRHVARLTELQQLLVAEEAMISDCLDREKFLLAELG